MVASRLGSMPRHILQHHPMRHVAEARFMQAPVTVERLCAGMLGHVLSLWPWRWQSPV